jgi:hypothetical protein
MSLGAAVLTSVALLLGLQPQALGYPVYSRMYRLKYGAQGGCNVCHDTGGGTRRNAYGDDWQNAGESFEAFGQIEGRDSDRDGTSNRQEIGADSNPGDTASTPARPGRNWRRLHQVPIPVEEIRMALGKVQDVGFRELDLTADQLKRLEKIAGRPLKMEERYPTIYLALENTRRTGALSLFAYPQGAGGPSALLVGFAPGRKLSKLLLLRAGADNPEIYRPLLDCLAKQDGRSAEKPACPAPKGREAFAAEIARALQLSLAIVESFES